MPVVKFAPIPDRSMASTPVPANRSTMISVIGRATTTILSPGIPVLNALIKFALLDSSESHVWEIPLRTPDAYLAQTTSLQTLRTPLLDRQQNLTTANINATMDS